MDSLSKRLRDKSQVLKHSGKAVVDDSVNLRLSNAEALGIFYQCFVGSELVLALAMIAESWEKRDLEEE